MDLFLTAELAIEAAEIKAASAAENLEYYDFDGDEYCNDGNGDCSWDGISRRCACSNRRVTWEADDLLQTDGSYLYYAIASAY